jgi:hypothetical protein
MMSSRGLSSYVGSANYCRDLDAVHVVWSPPTVLETAGTFVFLTYLTLPVLLAVRSARDSLARSVLDGERERRFLLRILGLDDDVAWRGGVENVRTRRAVESMSRYHQGFTGMRQEYLDFIAALIALSPLRVRERLASDPAADDRARYWRYISYALSMFGTQLGSEPVARGRCEAFTRAYARGSADGLELFVSLNEHHPRYVRLATPVLFDASGHAVRSLLQGAT